MRRAATQAFRNARQRPLQLLQRSALVRATSHNVRPEAPQRRFFSPSALLREAPPLRQIMTDAQYTRRFILTLCASVICSGTWIYYHQDYYGLQPNVRSPDTPKPLPSTQLASVSSSALAPSNPLQEPGAAQLGSPFSQNSLLEESDTFLAQGPSEASLDKPTEEQTYHMGSLSPEEATKRLRQNEESHLIGRGKGVVRYDLVQVASNNPIEDDHSEKIISVAENITPPADGVSRNDWMFWGVYDGHSGWTTSTKLRQALISYVARELDTTYKTALKGSALQVPTTEAINESIKRGFLNLDNDLVHKAVDKVLTSSTKRASTEVLAPALSGACALLSFYDSASKLLHVACTGYSRAVLGRRSSTGKWTATPLSEDQTGGTPSEIQRLRKEHPGEEYVTYKGRILGGLEPSRAFGDASYKWSKDIQLKVKEHFFGKTPSQLLKSPPYVTAEPIITTTKIEPVQGDFVVLATDGLWEMLTNEEVVGLVGRWLEKEESRSKASRWTGNLFGKSKEKNLPVEKVAGKTGSTEQGGQRAPIRQLQYGLESTDERFVVEDKNAATHLVRNALGGRDSDLVCALLSLISPNSRRYRYVPVIMLLGTINNMLIRRDDLTVQVIFFFY